MRSSCTKWSEGSSPLIWGNRRVVRRKRLQWESKPIYAVSTVSIPITDHFSPIFQIPPHRCAYITTIKNPKVPRRSKEMNLAASIVTEDTAEKVPMRSGRTACRCAFFYFLSFNVKWFIQCQSDTPIDQRIARRRVARRVSCFSVRLLSTSSYLSAPTETTIAFFSIFCAVACLLPWLKFNPILILFSEREKKKYPFQLNRGLN